MKYDIDYEGLSKFLHSLTYRGIMDDNLLTKAQTRDDIDYFHADDEEYKKSIDPKTIVEYGEPFLVDVLGNDLSVCKLTRRGFKLPTGRVVRCKLIKTIISDCRAVLGSPTNGYWVIPDKFIVKKKNRHGKTRARQL